MDTALELEAHRVLRRYGLEGCRLEPLRSAEHLLFRVRGRGADRCLKILPAEVSPAGARSQLAFMEHLRGAGLPVVGAADPVEGGPLPTASVEGRERTALLFDWVTGSPPSEGDAPAWIERAGELLARLHAASRGFRPPEGFEARSWDAIYAPADGGWLDRFLAEGPVRERTAARLREAARRVRPGLGREPGSPASHGLIHADLHRENLIDDGERLWILDFEDFGRGHFLFDLTWPAALFAKSGRDALEYLRPLLRGYGRVASPSEALPPGAGLVELLLAAGIAVVDMVHASPLDPAGSVARGWYEFVDSWLERWLDSTTDLHPDLLD